MNKISRFDLISLGLLIFILIISLIRFNYLPQFVDAYYHLSVANGFIKSGGWVGWSWWDFAPFGRPHLYPPFYHLILVFLQKIGLSGLNAIRITEVLITPLFFFFVWYSTRNIVNDRFSFFTLLILSSFFSFYSSVSANIPASLAIIFGFLTWIFIKKRKFISSTLFLILSFYTHLGIPWIFLISLFFLSSFNKEYRKLSLRVIFLSLFFFSPFLYHQFKYLNYIKLQLLREIQFIHFSIFIIIFGLISFFLHLGKNDFHILIFLGYFLGSLLIFIKYPYRFFSAQGMIGLAFFSSLFLEYIIHRLNYKKITSLFIIFVVVYLFFVHTTIDLDGSKIKFKIFNSTYYNILFGRVDSLFEFSSLFIPQVYKPILKVIQENTSEEDIISSNSSILSQILSSLSNRPTTSAMFLEVKPKDRYFYHNYAKLIIWLIPFVDSGFRLDKMHLKCLYKDDDILIFLNLNHKSSVKTIKAKINFLLIIFIFLLIFIIFFIDNLYNKT